jgi:1,4-alpha-glucan branching enzyme
LHKLIADLNYLYKNHSSWSSSDHKGDKFHWIDCDDASGQTLSFIKYGQEPEDTLLIACNFSDQLRHRDWGCPHSGEWNVILDTDSPDYGGAGASGSSNFQSFPESRNGQPNGLSFSVARWSVRILRLID